MTHHRSITQLMISGLGCAVLLAGCNLSDVNPDPTKDIAESGSSNIDDTDASPTGDVTEGAASSTTGSSGPDEPVDTTQGPADSTTGTSEPSDPTTTSEPSDPPGTSGTGEPDETTGTSGTVEPPDTTDGSSSTGEDDTGDGICDDLEALQAAAAAKGGQNKCPAWTGTLSAPGDCPAAGPGWLVEKVFPGAGGELGKYCYYEWIAGMGREWDLCGLPPDGARSPSQWLGPDCSI